MENGSQLTEFGKIFIFLITGIVLVSATLFLSKILALNRPTPLKLSSYECGEEPSGNSWLQFNSRFYVIALIFLLFDVEMIFIFPWTSVFGQKVIINAYPVWGWITLAEMFIFVGILLVGLLYVWRKGDLDWIRPEQKLPFVHNGIPLGIYDTINSDTYNVKAFSPELAAPINPQDTAPGSHIQTPVIKSAFKPKLK